MARRSDRLHEVHTAHSVSTGRRQFLKTAAASAALTAAGASAIPRKLFAQTQKKVTFTLPFTPNGNSMFAYVAKEKGFWSKRGLDVDISRGFGSVASAQAVAQGKFDFGMSAGPTQYLQAMKGMQIVSIGCVTYDPTMGVLMLDSSSIKTPKDLENTKMGSVVASGEYPFLPAFAENAKFDLSKVTIVQTDTKIRTSVLLSKQVDSISCHVASVIPSVKTRDINTRTFLYSNYGLKFYGQMFLTQPSRLASDKGTCEAMTEGAMEAVKWTMLNPDESLAIFFKHVKEAGLTKSSRDTFAIELGLFSHVNLASDVEAHGFGYVDPKEYQAMTRLIVQAMGKPGDKTPALDDVMTNQFVTDRFKFTTAEWNQIKEYTKQYANLLS